MKLRDCSKILVFLKLAHLEMNLNTISTRAVILQKSAGKKMVLFAHLEALIWPILSKRFAFALYQPCIYLTEKCKEKDGDIRHLEALNIKNFVFLETPWPRN